jgi:chemotaxis signal transduction protein
VSPRKPLANAHRGEPMILFAVGPHTFAIAASEVDEIRDLHDVAPLHQSVGFQMLPSKAARLLVLRHHLVAVTADSIDRMTDIASVQSLPSAFRGLERSWYRGLAVLDGNVVPVVNPAAFLSEAEAAEIEDKGAKS